MSMEADMVAAVLAVSTITDLIGDRFYSLQAPAAAERPLIVYQQISSEGDRSLGGVYQERRAQYQWRLVCDTYESIVALKTAVRDLAGTSASGISKIDIADGPDGQDYESQRETKIINVTLTK